ncbi:hypothetical protein KP509_09G042200 [Ceratopteris richardii]|uniref:U1 small nuclear ribonucleoprotein C n=1 Tax=Ceratopteris richardii TaxID=49495 RepID=A0A8T2U5Y3_CERRI|nr:hypothetical protein KP509_09G042200 [Ceratopteris richardii]
MPRYYCDYCDTYLTHDSPSVRKQHNAGYKHKANVRSYYQQFEEQQTQSLIDQKVKEHLGQAGYQQVGAAFHQHLSAFPTGPYRPPIAIPVLPVPGAVAGAIRPPVLPRPGVPPAGYGASASPLFRPPSGDMSGLSQPPTSLAPPGAAAAAPVAGPPSSFPVPPSSAYAAPGTTGTTSNGSYSSYVPASGAGTATFNPIGQGSSVTEPQYSSQQSGYRPINPPGSSNTGYSQGAPLTSQSANSTYPATISGAVSGYGT